MNWIDIILILVVMLSGLLGWQRGFVLSALDLIRWLGSWLAAILSYRFLSETLGMALGLDEIWRAPFAFIFVLVGMSFLIHLGGRYLLKTLSPDTHKHMVNRYLGIVPGAFSGVVMSALLSALMFAAPTSEEFSEQLEQSAIASAFSEVTSGLEGELADVFSPAVRSTLDRFRTVETGSDKFYELPFKVENSTPAPDLESQMLAMVNEERRVHGLPELKADPELTQVARRHSADMFARGYFSHNSPDGEDPFRRMRRAGIRYRAAGENLALAPTLKIAHTGLMNSPGHRANILSPKFGRLGIGIMRDRRRGLMVSQEFRD